MFKTKIASMTLAGILAIGGTTALAAEPIETIESGKPNITINFDKEAKLAEMAEKSAMIDAMKIEFEAKGAAFEEAKAKMTEKLLESGKTEEEISAILEKFSAKFDELKAEKALDIAEKKAEREANVAARADKGIAKNYNQVV